MREQHDVYGPQSGRPWKNYILYFLMIGTIIVLGSIIAVMAGFVDDPTADSGPIQDVTQNETEVTVSISSDHESEGIVLIHPDNKEYIIWEEELEPFGGTYSISNQVLRCDDANFPNNTFKLQLVTVESTGQGGITTEVQSATEVEFSDSFLNGDCESSY